MPDASTRIDTFKFDGRAWEEVAVPFEADTEDPLLQVEPLRLELEPDSPFVAGQFAQTTVSDPQTGETRLLVKFPLLDASDFKARQSIEIDLRTRLFRGSARFAGSVWNDRLATREATIPQRVRDGDAVQQVATDATLVVVDNIQIHHLRVQAAPNPFTPNGDGLTDEDRIDLIDNDGDGLVDEDGRKLRRAPRSSFAKDGELAFVGWSEWSENYQPTDGRSEAAITSPSPRKFVQIRFKISSEDPFKTARIRSFHIDLAPPLALELAGELALVSPQGMTRPIDDLGTAPRDYSPPRDINPLAPQHFSYFARLASPDPDDPTVRDGVDEILIVAPQAAELLGVRIGRVEVERQASDFDPAIFSTRVLKTHFDQAFARGPDGRLQDADGQTIAMLPTGPDSLYLRFPTSLNADLPPNLHALVEVQFASRAFREGVLFPAFARSSTDSAGFFQRVDAEAQDATELVASGTARVSLQAVGRRLINDVQVVRVFTPNGDGVNDLLQGRFVLLRILAERRLDIAFYDLAGALRGRAGSDLGRAGQWNFAWDGRDQQGQLVPPGIYLCRIKIAADRGAEEEIFPVHVAY